jgi:fatty acid desaturase
MSLVLTHPRSGLTRPRTDDLPTTPDQLTEEQFEAIGRELDALRAEVMNDLGKSDAAYIRRMIRIQRSLELASRVVLLFSWAPPAFVLGTLGLATAKILDNMEIGHNVLHGQWDWMRDPKIHSTTWEWDFDSPAAHWKQTHNDSHHTWTNVLGKDEDLGFGIMRVDEKQPWTLSALTQPVAAVANALFFQYGIAIYDTGVGRHLRGDIDKEAFRKAGAETLRKLRRQLLKDYVVFPALSGPAFLSTIAANALANLIRNIWANSVIICGHFPDGVQTFPIESIENETRGHWYVRQMLGSGNITGSKLMHIMTGNLSHQIEHHLFPDMPSNRLGQVAPRVQEILQRHGLTYNAGTLRHQLGSVWAKIFKLSLPEPQPGRTRTQIVAGAVGEAARDVGTRLRRRVRQLAAPPHTHAALLG